MPEFAINGPQTFQILGENDGKKLIIENVFLSQVLDVLGMVFFFKVLFQTAANACFEYLIRLQLLPVFVLWVH